MLPAGRRICKHEFRQIKQFIHTKHKHIAHSRQNRSSITQHFIDYLPNQSAFHKLKQPLTVKMFPSFKLNIKKAKRERGNLVRWKLEFHPRLPTTPWREKQKRNTDSGEESDDTHALNDGIQLKHSNLDSETLNFELLRAHCFGAQPAIFISQCFK